MSRAQDRAEQRPSAYRCAGSQTRLRLKGRYASQKDAGKLQRKASAARIAPPVLPARPTQEVTAAYPYQGQRASDLSFAAGDVIVVTRKKANGWWVGHVRGRDPATAGEFPSNYVR